MDFIYNEAGAVNVLQQMVNNYIVSFSFLRFPENDVFNSQFVNTYEIHNYVPP